MLSFINMRQCARINRFGHAAWFIVLAATPVSASPTATCSGSPPANGKEFCYYHSAKKKKSSETLYKDGKKVGPEVWWREDGTLSSIKHFLPNAGGFTTEEWYYETGGIERAEFHRQIKTPNGMNVENLSIY